MTLTDENSIFNLYKIQFLLIPHSKQRLSTLLAGVLHPQTLSSFKHHCVLCGPCVMDVRSFHWSLTFQVPTTEMVTVD